MGGQIAVLVMAEALYSRATKIQTVTPANPKGIPPKLGIIQAPPNEWHGTKTRNWPFLGLFYSRLLQL